MKNIKNVIYGISFALLIFLFNPINTSAKTLGQLKQEYSALEEKYNNTTNSIKANEAQQAAASARVKSIYTELANAEKEIQNINVEITKLNESILKKDSEIKSIMKYYQFSNGESSYLEYAFGAKSLTDFIYRLSITEQLTTYNSNLIKEMHAMITQNNENIKKLHEKEDSLAALQVELQSKLVILSAEKQQLTDEEDSIQKQVEYSKSIINYYIKAGCKESQDIATCANKQLPAGTRFWRPLQSGMMYSTWWTDVLSGGGCRTHAGVDIADPAGTPVYSISDGKVVLAAYSGDGYGNKVVVHHNINGQNYTSLYGHLSAINVKVGDIVTKDTIIGKVGNTGRSYGNHLHLNVCVGLKTCVSRGDTVDPGSYINFPANKKSFTDRTTSYSGYYSNPCK